MPNLNISNIQWPCKLTDESKGQLISISQHGTGLPNTDTNHPIAGLYYILSGLASFSITTENINNSLGIVIGVDDWIDAKKIVNQSQTFFIAQELETVEYLFFPQQKVLQLAENNVEIYKLLYHSLNEVQLHTLQASLTALHDKELRIVYTLLSLAKKKKLIQGAKVSIKITQVQLCVITGLSRSRINEVLKSIEKSHQISIERGTIHLIDINALGNRLERLNTMFNDPRK